MSKCNKCKYEYLSKRKEPCKYCRERFSECTPNYMMHEDKFEPKEEQSTTEYKGCNDCYYEWLGESDAPCCECKHCFEPRTMARLKAKDCYVPKDKSSNCTISCKEGNKDFVNEDYGFKEISKDEVDMVNHPPHYVGHGIEPIEFIESHNLNFNLGSAVKYIARAPYKGTELLDLKKAKWFIEREIKRHEK